MFSGFVTGYDAAMPSLPNNLMKPLVQGYERHQTRLIIAVNALLIVGIAFASAKLLWSLVPTPDAARWQPTPVQTQTSSSNAGTAGLNTIINAHLFGIYKAAVSTDVSSAPETRLDLKLLGILAGTRASDSRAIISQSGAAEKAYAIGDDVVRGASLQAIFPDRVIISRDGQMETLRLDPTLGGSSSESPPPQRTNYDSGNLPQQLSQARQEMLQDPSKTADYIRVQPNNTNGQLHGYRIYPGKNAGVFNNAGLKPGDLVTSVNGIALDDNQKALQMLNDMSKANSVNLTVDRSGQLQTINVTFN
jgi:general secretion pathway protein C